MGDEERERCGRTEKEDLDGLLAALVGFLGEGNLLIYLLGHPCSVLLLANAHCAVVWRLVRGGLEGGGERVVGVWLGPEGLCGDGSHRVLRVSGREIEHRK